MKYDTIHIIIIEILIKRYDLYLSLYKDIEIVGSLEKYSPVCML